MSSETVLIV